jgi:hypothetical protein
VHRLVIWLVLVLMLGLVRGGGRLVEWLVDGLVTLTDSLRVRRPRVPAVLAGRQAATRMQVRGHLVSQSCAIQI